jgi:prepilin-type N-terminal cleavage/methylation domain-containing protein
MPKAIGMHTASSDRGFTLIELLLSTTIMLIVIATGMTAFRDGLLLNDTASLIADSNQNLRAGTNLLVRDLLQAGRGIPVGGVPLPSGAGVDKLNRPSPAGTAYQFDNTTATTLPAIVSGSDLGPMVNGQPTDMITLLAVDPLSYVEYTPGAAAGVLELNWTPDQTQWPAGLTAPTPTLANDGASLNVGQFSTWISDPVNGIKAGDVLLFTNQLGSAIQTVTSTSSSQVFFASGALDTFNFNQRGAPQGSIIQIRNGATFPQTTVVRLQMVTYYVDTTTTPGVPRLVRQYNHFVPQALAGIVEDLSFSYDLVDGVTNPTEIEDLPYMDPSGVLYTENQIRKVNLHVGVRSETRSSLRDDYLRHHLATVVSIRSLAYIDRYK